MVDDDDFEEINKFKWLSEKRGNTFYAQRTDYSNGNNNRIRIKMHRLIMQPEKGMVVDHKDRNGLNNQKNNLRICTDSENLCNRTAYGKSKYLGVSWRKNRRTWQAVIKQRGGKYIYLGGFKIETEAALAYNEAAKKYHGEFANLNIIETY